MKKVTYFHMSSCPYCIQADQVIQELIQENPAWAAVTFEQIDETVHPEIADNYDYYYNPCMYIGREKLYESHPRETKDDCRAHVEAVFRRAMED